MPVNIAISVEGQTEESFIKQILAPYLETKNIYIEPITVITKRLASQTHRGGTIAFDKAIRDISKLLNPKYDLVTTFYDYYGLNRDFLPEQPDHDVYKNVKLIENKMAVHVNNDKFLPYIQLHEFETFLFVEADITTNNLMDCRKYIVEKAINTALQQANNNPELVNNSKETAPSKRILSVYSSYQKVTDGPNICKDLGIQKIREKCPHFNEWLTDLLEYSDLVLNRKINS